jgi:FixJ family two-component response regulator
MKNFYEQILTVIDLLTFSLTAAPRTVELHRLTLSSKMAKSLASNWIELMNQMMMSNMS